MLKKSSPNLKLDRLLPQQALQNERMNIESTKDIYHPSVCSVPVRMIGSPISMKAYRVLEDYAQQSDKEISLQGETTVFVISKRDDGKYL